MWLARAPNSFQLPSHSLRRNAFALDARPRPSPDITAHWPPQAEMLPQRTALVLAAEQPAASQLGNHQLDKVIETARQVRRHDVEAVAAVLAEPFLHMIGDLLRRAADDAFGART